MKLTTYFVLREIIAQLQLCFAGEKRGEQLIISKCKLECNKKDCLSHCKCAAEGSECLPVSFSKRSCTRQCSCTNIIEQKHGTKATAGDWCDCYCNAGDKKGPCVIEGGSVLGSNECDRSCYKNSVGCKRRGVGCGTGREIDCYGIVGTSMCNYRKCSCE